MQVRLLSMTRLAPTLADQAGNTELAALTRPAPGATTLTEQERLAEFAARVCYRSTDKMGHNPTFVAARVREGHEDIIEHITFVVQVTEVAEGDPAVVDGPVRWRLENRHLEATRLGNGWVVSGNARVWLDLFRRGLASAVRPLLRPLAPTIYDAEQP